MPVKAPIRVQQLLYQFEKNFEKTLAMMTGPKEPIEIIHVYSNEFNTFVKNFTFIKGLITSSDKPDVPGPSIDASADFKTRMDFMINCMNELSTELDNFATSTVCEKPMDRATIEGVGSISKQIRDIHRGFVIYP